MLHLNKISMFLKITIAAVVILLALTSCKNESVSADTEYFAELDGRSVIYKDGMYTFENGLLSFLSFDTCKTLPVCYKPNCTHDTEDCPAYMPNVSTIFVYGDSLYSFASEYEWDKNDGKATINTTLYRSDVSGANRRKYSSLEGLRVQYGAYVKDGKAYFTASEAEFDETGSTTGSTAEYLYSCDLLDGSMEELAKIAEGYNALLSISGCYDRRLVLEYREGGEDAESQAESRYSFYDPKKGDIEAIKGRVIRAQKGWLILKNGDKLEIYSTGSNEPYIITDNRYVDPEWGGYAISGNRLILSADGIAIDLETKNEYTTLICTIIARYNDGFIVRIAGQQGYKLVTDGEFYSVKTS